ncbi:hypothetical protein Pse7367_1063 [Thalassoporum mexicanum PCC 7367]|uniref:hypothetical protein n=1 Tax=Thalassoporum mexicanum TaxID=3457544 RepID=UPI00029F8CED|nr:hypothetical protein [Pseudanabaena sp. PCC 7367]AFY69361.1 hypothetical protein Pse7367_1063 [Pseudanabaena sp. PCC 7367]
MATIDIFMIIALGSMIGIIMFSQYAAPGNNLASCQSTACRRATVADANFLDRTFQLIPTIGISFLFFLVLAAIAAR